MKKVITVSLLCAVLMGVSARAQTQDTMKCVHDSTIYGSILGKVLDLDTKEKLPAVKITIDKSGLSTKTDLDGVFYIKCLMPGKYTLRISLKGYKPQIIRDQYVIKNTTSIVAIDLKAATNAKEYLEVIPRAMIFVEPSGSIHIWTKQEIERLPGH